MVSSRSSCGKPGMTPRESSSQIEADRNGHLAAFDGPAVDGARVHPEELRQLEGCGAGSTGRGGTSLGAALVSGSRAVMGLCFGWGWSGGGGRTFGTVTNGTMMAGSAGGAFGGANCSIAR